MPDAAISPGDPVALVLHGLEFHSVPATFVGMHNGMARCRDRFGFVRDFRLSDGRMIDPACNWDFWRLSVRDRRRIAGVVAGAGGWEY